MKLQIDTNDEDKKSQEEEERVNPVEGQQETGPDIVVPPSNKYERSFKSLAEEELKQAAGEALGTIAAETKFDVSLYEPSEEILAVFAPLMEELSVNHAKLSEDVK